MFQRTQNDRIRSTANLELSERRRRSKTKHRRRRRRRHRRRQVRLQLWREVRPGHFGQSFSTYGRPKFAPRSPIASATPDADAVADTDWSSSSSVAATTSSGPDASTVRRPVVVFDVLGVDGVRFVDAVVAADATGSQKWRICAEPRRSDFRWIEQKSANLLYKGEFRMAVDFTVAITASQLSFLLKVVIDLAGYRSKSSLIQVTIDW